MNCPNFKEVPRDVKDEELDKYIEKTKPVLCDYEDICLEFKNCPLLRGGYPLMTLVI